MAAVLQILMVLCLVYYLVIAVYSGISTSFAFVWIIFAVISGGLSMYIRFYQRNPEKVPLGVLVSGTTVCITSLLIFVIVEVLVFSGVASSGTPNLDYVIVLGAKVQGENVSTSLRYRLDRAMEYLEDNPDTILVLSGGHGNVGSKTEAEAMYDYLVYNGVRPEQTVMEIRSQSTLENVVFSLNLIYSIRDEKKNISPIGAAVGDGEVLTAPDKPLRIGILTSNFHAFRSYAVAKKWSSDEIHTIAARSDPVLFIHLCVRECMAILKDKLMGNI